MGRKLQLPKRHGRADLLLAFDAIYYLPLSVFELVKTREYGAEYWFKTGNIGDLFGLETLQHMVIMLNKMVFNLGKAFNGFTEER